MFQSGYFSSPHEAGLYHAYAVSPDGQRFLIPQIDNPVAVFTGGRGAAGLGINAGRIIGAIYNDRHAATSSASSPSVPINVVLNWTTALKEN